jgi:hypothetical protein
MTPSGPYSYCNANLTGDMMREHKADRFPELTPQDKAEAKISAATWAWIDTATDLLALVLVSGAVSWAVGSTPAYGMASVGLLMATLAVYRQHRARQKINQLEQKA